MDIDIKREHGQCQWNSNNYGTLYCLIVILRMHVGSIPFCFLGFTVSTVAMYHKFILYMNHLPWKINEE